MAAYYSAHPNISFIATKFYWTGQGFSPKPTY